MKETPNLTYIYTLSNGNKIFEKSLLDIIKKELPYDAATYRLHLKDSDFNKIAEDVHKIHHKIKILGLEKGSQIAKEYRANLSAKSLKLKTEFEGILTSMLLFIEKV